MSTKSTIGKCSVWIYGAEMGTAGWVNGLVLEVGEGFASQSEAKGWAREAMRRLDVPGKTKTERYKIGPAY